jgi:hypothetical protein
LRTTGIFCVWTVDNLVGLNDPTAGERYYTHVYIRVRHWRAR